MGVARRAIWLLNLVICLGYLMIWIMMPTKTFNQIWLTKLETDFTPTYFGSQGTTLLVYMFPVLFVAVTSSIYLHLSNKSSSSNNINDIEWKEEKKMRNNLLTKWRQPILVKGPLGIVSRIELAFITMFIALLIWSFYTNITVYFSELTPEVVHLYGGKLWRTKLDTASLTIGLVGYIALSLLFFPVTRGSSILSFFGLTSEGSIKYHIWLGHTVMTLFTAHGIGYIVFWIASSETSQMLKWEKVGISNVAGEISLLSGLILWSTTFPKIRRKFFELFFYTHYLYILFIFFFVLHVGIAYATMMLPGFYLFIIDRYLRFLQSRQSVRLISSRILPSGDTIELNFSKSLSLNYTTTSILFVNVPSISKLQWHPFTITSSSKLEKEKLSVVIKVEGSWTRKLYQMLASSSLKFDRLQVSTEGPYGPASTQFLRHESLVMVSGGSGITPFFSIIREMIHYNTVLKIKTPKLLLICAFKKSSELSMLDLLLPFNHSELTTNLDLCIEAYITREKIEEQKNNDQKSIQHIWFKPKTTDAPISPVLGSNGWLWLAAIISSSFLSFLLFMGILTRYYIYPTDHSTGQIFSLSTRSTLNVLIICICIAVCCSIAFTRNKKRTAMEDKQIVNMEGITPNTTPQSSWLYDGDRELESLPQQSIVQATNVHFGQRPDLKRILFDCKWSSVGVLVCGPKKMRHEVAAICSSGLTDNLHFESISFSW